MGAHIARDQDLGGERTVREFISEFRGLSGSAKQKAVLDEVGAAQLSLANYFGAGVVDHAANARLLAACQKHTRPVKPGDLGVIGKQHLEAIFVAAGAAPKSFEYRRTPGVLCGAARHCNRGSAHAAALSSRTPTARCRSARSKCATTYSGGRQQDATR
jgi:hypothetical protein